MDKVIFKKADIIIPKKDFAKVKGVHILSLCEIKNDKGRQLENFLESVRFKREPFLKASLLLEAQRLIARANQDWITEEWFAKKIRFINFRLKDLWDEYQYFLKQLHHDFLTQQIVIENITTTVGRSVLARRLAGDNTYSANVSHTALGSSNTAPSVANTTLGTETYRKVLSSGNFSSNISYLETFFTAAEVTGTFEEYANFIDGSGTSNSGQMLNRFTQTITKSSVETLNVASTITINDA